ncbi:pyridoxamine 5'-phosphate oxidase family protein [Pseudoduganella eburnea]|uniref:Pyridoxamine 5'-phosphate oxidase family protein n=1 Tax=Massilia eburnea TaxID=1776165 RepID=A0A6L6QBV8_9BURK|nr:pyridoxamine 5'-phosphate oxidase family protein [Massilia eburnea]MTW09700.1 pyridoxamine 5'-phosphate oxidase family protein [Massilia eburnea]
MKTTLPPSDRTRVKRIARNASYEQDQARAIVDAAYICHIAFSDGYGAHCIPTACWREGDYLYIHGSNGSRMLQQLVAQDACVTITHLDGLVMARSAFNHSMNYRSVMIYGRFEEVDEAGKRASLAAFMEHLAPGRQAEIRPGNDKEFAATTVLRIALAEAACKVRSGGVEDDEEDMGVAAWAGILPFTQLRLAPQQDPACQVAPPEYVRNWAA